MEQRRQVSHEVRGDEHAQLTVPLFGRGLAPAEERAFLYESRQVHMSDSNDTARLR